MNTVTRTSGPRRQVGFSCGPHTGGLTRRHTNGGIAVTENGVSRPCAEATSRSRQAADTDTAFGETSPALAAITKTATKGKMTHMRAVEDQDALDLAADWADICVGLRKDLGQQLFSQWIRPIQLGAYCQETGTLDLYLPTEFSAGWVADRFADRLTLAWKIARDVRHVRIAVQPGRRQMPDLRIARDNGAYAQTGYDTGFSRSRAQESGQGRAIGLVAAETVNHAADGMGGLASIGLDPSLTFASFVTGNANVLACNAAQRMAAIETPQFSPLYLKAATGQGKTHLMHAIGHAYLAAHPRARIFYCSAERFMVEFVQALRQNQMIEFKSRLRGFDLLLVDDIQFIIGKASAQEELLYTIDALLAEGKRLVFAADRAPQALDGVEQRLLSRLSMGLVADIAPADIELRRAILESRLGRFSSHTEVPADVIEFLARTINRNVRESVGGLNKLIAYAQLTGQAVSLQLAEEQLTDILSANRKRITIDEIQRTVCQFYRVDRTEMSSKRRARAVVRPRQVAMYLAKVLTPRSYPEIGRKFGGRDHSTVIHAVRLIEDLRTRDADMDGDVRSLLRQLES